MTNEDITEWHKSRVRFYESTIKDVKETLQMFFKEHKTWIDKGLPAEDAEWYKGFVRDLKNSLESGYKDCMLEYKHHREGMNPPGCYERIN